MRKAAAALVAAACLASASPLAAFTLIELLKPNKSVTFNQTLLCDGSVRLEKGVPYGVQVAMGDGSVRASFFDQTGRKVGEAHGIIAVLKPNAAAGAPAPGAMSSQKVQPAAGQAAAPQTFAKLGFSANSPLTVKVEGQTARLDILSTDGVHTIQIGLLVPAVQKVREAAARRRTEVP